eukprot:scaffold5944_cov62-Phaeocystis_antarctica.AAC.1
MRLIMNLIMRSGCACFPVTASSGIEPARAEFQLSCTSRPNHSATGMRVAIAAVRCILITGPSSPHPGVDTGAYATPLVAYTGRGARHTDGRDRGGYMSMH